MIVMLVESHFGHIIDVHAFTILAAVVRSSRADACFLAFCLLLIRISLGPTNYTIFIYIFLLCLCSGSLAVSLTLARHTHTNIFITKSFPASLAVGPIKNDFDARRVDIQTPKRLSIA